MLTTREAFEDAACRGLILLALNLPRKDGREARGETKASPQLRPAYERLVTEPVDFDRFVEAIRQIENFFVTVVNFRTECRAQIGRTP